jgi:chromosome partitioning protein
VFETLNSLVLGIELNARRGAELVSYHGRGEAGSAMAVEVDEQLKKIFDALYLEPSLEQMRELDPKVFEQFVAPVFTCAGYGVRVVADIPFPEGPGVDLDLYDPVSGQLCAHAGVRRYAAERPIRFQQVAAFVGMLDMNHPAVPGFLITTSRFTPDGHQGAAQAKHAVHLIDGEQFRRYITYVGGSRSKDGLKTAGPTEPIAPTVILVGDTVKDHHKPVGKRAPILVVANNKGGVAKTTTALNIAFDLARSHTEGRGRARTEVPGQHILLIDTDGQTSLTTALPAPDIEPGPADLDLTHLGTYFGGQCTLRQAIRDTRFDNVSLIPAHPDLLHLTEGGAARARAELAFIDDVLAIAETGDENDQLLYDWIVIDTAPAQALFTRAALGAADYVLASVKVEQFAVLGVNRMRATLKTMHALTDGVDSWPNRLMGYVVTCWRANEQTNDALAKIALEFIKASIPSFPIAIPIDSNIDRAHEETITGGVLDLFHFGTSLAAAAKAYNKLTQEVVKRAH